MTDADLPEPPVPSDCDLTEFQFTPIYRSRLFGSLFHAKADDAEWRAGVTLWLKAWDQVPAGSLPNDETALCRLAELGRDVKTWAKVRARALHGWFECSDGRLYHNVVAEGVLDAWTKRKTASKKGIAGAKARWRKLNATASEKNGRGNGTGNATAIARAMPGDSKGQGEGQRPLILDSDPSRPKEGKVLNSFSGNGSGKKNGYGNGSVTIKDPRERIERFKNAIAKRLGPSAWSIIEAASDPAHEDHADALRTCKMAAKALDKGWPHEWFEPTAAH